MSSSSSSSRAPDTVKPEKPSFSQTCSLLSQYLKEKGNLGHGLGMARNVQGNGVPEIFRPDAAPTMNLFPILNEKADDVPRDEKPMELFPHPNGMEDSSKRPIPADSSVTAQKQPGGAQMTIFYGGQVIVFNDFPADKAKDVMMLASKASSSASSNPQMATFSGPNMAPERIQCPTEPIASDLPIARRASLHRFLEKRKNRITARSPYVVATSEAAPSKLPESKQWLGLAAQPTQ